MAEMISRTWIARRIAVALARDLLAGTWNRRALLRRAKSVLGRAPKALARLIGGVPDQTGTSYPPSPAQLTLILTRSPEFETASGAAAKAIHRLPAVPKPPKFAPAPRFAGLDIPRLTTEGDLAAWLGLSAEHLEWFADQRRQQVRTVNAILQHYDYVFVPKSSGPPRLVEAPKPKLKALQRRILREILDKLPPHDCAFGFVAGRSCLDAAQQHAGEANVIALDLKDFFAGTPLKRVHGIFRSFGYPWAVARNLTDLCSTATPEAVFMRLPRDKRHDWATRRLYQTRHLAQGAPTSPALANFAAWGLDARLQGLAARLGCHYTRYADDLAFSGDGELAGRPGRLSNAIEAIVADEGYRLNAGKTRVMRTGRRQRLTGVVVNEHVNVPRTAFDCLKAILHNCVTHGPVSQNRAGAADFRAHLDGRIAWVEQVNPPRGEKLRAIYDLIAW